MSRLDHFRQVDVEDMAEFAKPFDPSAFVAAALLKRALRAARMHHVLYGAPCVFVVADVPAQAADAIMDAAEALLRSGTRGLVCNRSKVHDRTGKRADRTPDASHAIANLHSTERVCWLYDTLDTVPNHVAGMSDGMAVVPVPDAGLLRAAVLKACLSAPSASDLTAFASIPWSSLSDVLAPGRPVRYAASLARRIGTVLLMEEGARSENSSDGSPPAACVAPGPTLDDLHGLGEAAEWGRALAMDLADYRAERIGWNDVDRGALVSGPPGTGKTTFALALGRTCGVPVFVHSLARWQAAGYLNDLLKKMRAAFAEAIAAAPCILFVDELDSFGDRTHADQHGARYAREVINAFLECLDGAEGRPGVVVVGATNHPHLVDPAIRRAGRLDRGLAIPLPDPEARDAILRFHLRGELADAGLADVVDAMQGKCGADLEQLVRSARRTARTSRRPMEIGDLVRALPPAIRLTDAAFRRVCVHEAGHVVVGQCLAAVSGSVPIRAVARRDVRAPDFSQTEFTIEKGVDGTRSSYLDLVTTLLSGMAAELELLGDRGELSGGAGNSDLAKATKVVARLELDLGLGTGDCLAVTGLTSDGDIASRLERDRSLRRRVERTLAECLERARTIVRERREDAVAVAACLEKHGSWQATPPIAATEADGDRSRRETVRVRRSGPQERKRRTGAGPGGTGRKPGPGTTASPPRGTAPG